MLTFLMVVITFLLAYVAYSLHAIVVRSKDVDENVKLIVERQMSSTDDISRIERAMHLNFKRESEDFSETRIEELLRSGNWIEAVKYRRTMSTDLVDEAFNYARQTAKRIGVAMPGDEESKTL